MSTDCECIVIGAGVIGLAVAAELARGGREVVLLEQAAAFGTVTSARNSEVIHAGIYYTAGSLKARLCVAGRDLLYRYCHDHAIAHARCGKLIVATTEAQASQLDSIRARAIANGVNDIRLIAQDEAMAMEPELRCLAALHSPSTGIIDSHGFMLSLLGDAERHGAVLATHTPVEALERHPTSGLYTVHTGGANAMSLNCCYVVNAAGHGACRLTASLAASLSGSPAGIVAGDAASEVVSEVVSEVAGDAADDVAGSAARDAQHDASGSAGQVGRLAVPEAVLSKGNYFRLIGKAPFEHLVYTVPEVGGLGVHVTMDLGGQVRFGPDVEAVSEEDYTVDATRSAGFYQAVRDYWPGLPDNSLVPDYAGIRPRLRFGQELYTDFLIDSPRTHGFPGLVNLLGIESPGLTASLAIAREVRLQLS